MSEDAPEPMMSPGRDAASLLLKREKLAVTAGQPTAFAQRNNRTTAMRQS